MNLWVGDYTHYPIENYSQSGLHTHHEKNNISTVYSGLPKFWPCRGHKYFFFFFLIILNSSKKTGTYLFIYFIFVFQACTVETTGQSGECIFIGNCPVVLMEYQKLKKMPTICDRQYRTVCCPSAIKQPIENPITSTTARVLRRISAQSKTILSLVRLYVLFNTVFRV